VAAGFGNSEQRHVARGGVGNIMSFHQHCHGSPSCDCILAAGILTMFTVYLNDVEIISAASSLHRL
jgi:hypothetical protein